MLTSTNIPLTCEIVPLLNKDCKVNQCEFIEVYIKIKSEKKLVMKDHSDQLLSLYFIRIYQEYNYHSLVKSSKLHDVWS